MNWNIQFLLKNIQIVGLVKFNNRKAEVNESSIKLV